MHSKSKLFSLIGRRVRLLEPFYTQKEGIIAKQIGPGTFILNLLNADGTFYHSIFGEVFNLRYHRAEFALIPLPRQEPKWLSDTFEGFVYGPEFVNPFALTSCKSVI